MPLLVEWPNGQREALLFTLEEETDPGRFSIHRLAHYTLHLSELFDTERVVPVVIFLKSNNNIAESLHIRSERHSYLQFHYLHTHLNKLHANQYFSSQNIVARLNLPNMAWAKKDKIDVYANAIQGLFSLEPSVEKQLKYIDFVDIYSDLSTDERKAYQRRYPQEESKMAGLAERLRTEGMQQGMQQGMQKGELNVLLRLLTRRFGPLDSATKLRLQEASSEELERWADNILDAASLDEVFAGH